jgi:hypothetical protein
MPYTQSVPRRKKQSPSRLWGHMVAQLAEALGYKAEGPGSIPDGVIGIFH